MDEILDQLDAGAKQYPMKALAAELCKPEGSLRNELHGQEGYKLGFFTAIEIIRKTKVYRVLDWAEAQCGRISHKLPKNTENFGDLCELAGEMALQFGSQMMEFGAAMADGKITRAEADRWLGELNKANQRGLELQSCLQNFVKKVQP